MAIIEKVSHFLGLNSKIDSAANRKNSKNDKVLQQKIEQKDNVFQSVNEVKNETGKKKPANNLRMAIKRMFRKKL